MTVEIPLIDRRAAFRDQRADVLEFCESLGSADWRMNSRAQGWSITDVVAHMGSGCHVLFTPSALRLMRAGAIEDANDALVDARRDRTPRQVFGEYRRWSRIFGSAIPLLVRAPLGVARLPLAELGSFPMRLLVSALVFDHHTHLSFDIAPALGRTVPAADANRMAAVLEWMTAVLSNQVQASRPGWLDRPLSITLTGPGGGSWTVGPSGTIRRGTDTSAGAHITGLAAEFPEWATRRASWRDRDVVVTGDIDYGAGFLDAVHIV